MAGLSFHSPFPGSRGNLAAIDHAVHFLVIGLGTHGELLPLMTLGSALRARGHRVTFICPPSYGQTLTANNISFSPLCTSDEYARSIEDMYLLRTRYRMLFTLRYIAGWNATIYRRIMAMVSTRPRILSVDLGMLWADYYGYYSWKMPVIRLAFDPPSIPEKRNRSLRRTGVQDHMAQALEQKWRDALFALGIKVRHGHLRRLIRTGSKTVPKVELFPRWLEEKAENNLLCKFGFVPPSPLGLEYVTTLPSNFIGKRLLVFSAGTLGISDCWSQSLFAMATQICSRIGAYGVCLGGRPLDPPWPPPNIVWKDFLPFPKVLPYASIIVHHGGIGTSAMALEHGVPQLIVPQFGIQLSTADRFKRLGVAIILESADFKATRVLQCINELVGNNRYRKSIARYSRKCYSETSVEDICNFLEAEKSWRALSKINPMNAQRLIG